MDKSPATPDQALTRAIKAVGTSKEFAKKIGVSPQAVSQWERVPVGRVLKVEAVTKVSRYRLRPDIYGDGPGPRQRKQQASV